MGTRRRYRPLQPEPELVQSGQLVFDVLVDGRMKQDRRQLVEV